MPKETDTATSALEEPLAADGIPKLAQSALTKPSDETDETTLESEGDDLTNSPDINSKETDDPSPQTQMPYLAPDTTTAVDSEVVTPEKLGPPSPEPENAVSFEEVSTPPTQPSPFHMTNSLVGVTSPDRPSELPSTIEQPVFRARARETSGVTVTADDGRDRDRPLRVDEDSSDDDSSYFADPSNLPSPKSVRRYSFSSNASVPAGRNRVHLGAMSRESDASLSRSEDSDDAVHHSDSGMFPGHTRGVTELYPQRLTRVHSVSSLVSTSSQGSDPSTREELLKANLDGSGTVGVPSGRLSPILGEHPPSRNGAFFSSPLSVPGASPPTIMPSYQRPYGFPHPQPHTIMQNQVYAAWMAAGNAGGFPVDARSSVQSTETAWSKDRNELLGDDANSESKDQSDTPDLNQYGGKIQAKGEHDIQNRNRNGTDNGEESAISKEGGVQPEEGFKVYWQRWMMLFYMSLLNLLSDWTCYSVAPIAVLTEEAFGQIDPELLVVVFLCANGVATACEPIILSRLGLRRTVLFGALLLMIGSIVKSGGMPPIIQADLQKGKDEWRVYLGFLLVGLSQPLYQCTPALLSASWFPERERTMATGVALNSNQLGIGFAFIFGTLLVAKSDDIPGYFGLLSIISTLTFMGVLFQFDDAPPTPPSDTARVMRGTFEMKLPNSMRSIFDSVRGINISIKPSRREDTQQKEGTSGAPKAKDSPRSSAPSASVRSKESSRRRSTSSRKSGKSRKRTSNSTRRLAPTSDSNSDDKFHGLAPAPARHGAVSNAGRLRYKGSGPAPSPMMPGRVGPIVSDEQEDEKEEAGEEQFPYPQNPQFPANPYLQPPYGLPPGGESERMEGTMPYGLSAMPYGPPPESPYDQSAAAATQYGPQEGGISYAYPPHQGYAPYPTPYWDPRINQYVYYQQPMYNYGATMDPYYYSYQNQYPPIYGRRTHPQPFTMLPPAEAIDDGAEPVLTMTDHHLEIDIKDDQIILSTRACLARPGFIHALVSFTVSGIVINTLSTFMDYLVRLNGAGREYTGIVGGSFQFVIMISSLLVGSLTDKTRAYYSVTICMLVLGAFGLAQCGVSLDADRGSDLRWSLVIVAALVGPLQPVSTELGVDVVYPLSENTVLVIQQLFSNVLSALFIPCFKAMKDVGLDGVQDTDEERPAFTFSFYLLIVLHAAATVFFATFNGRYLRFEHELEKKAAEEYRKSEAAAAAFQPVHHPYPRNQMAPIDGSYFGDRQPLIPPVV